MAEQKKTDTGAPENDEKQRREALSKRTTGNKLFDLLVYPTIAFGAVFAFSVWMLHATKFGAGKARVKYDGWVSSTAEWFEGLSFFKNKTPAELHKKADNYISVLVSFAAGTLLIAPIKWFEDARGKISRSIDRMLGSTPDDPAAYEQEPKQSWGSVLGGRAVTFGLVLALATVVGKYINKGAGKIAEITSHQWEKIQPQVSAKKLQHIKDWSYVSAFEGFYTALCAGLLYVFSRSLARSMNKDIKDAAPAVPYESTSPAEESPLSDTKLVSYAAREAVKQTQAEELATRGV